MKSQCGPPAGGPGDDRRRRLIVALGHRPVPGQLHENRAGDRHFGSRRPGDEPRRQGQDARRPGRQSRVDREPARRQGRRCTWRWIPSQLQLIPSNVMVDIASSTVFGAKSVEMVAPADPSPEPLRAGQVIQSAARHRRDQHRLPATHVRCWTRSTRQAQRDARRDRDGVQRPRREVRQDADRLQRLPGQDRTQPAQPQPRPRSRCSDTERVRRRGARPRQDRRAAPSQISNTIVDQQQNLDEFLVSAIGLADIGNDVIGGNRPGADRCAAPAGAHHGTAQPVPRIADVAQLADLP